ncbi:hypothetical protein [Stenotrophomonas indicatrix]|uniref:hypothetical protein n=1 Tax=Stenotrophomonas indicatrix TaxID=2045451 RepID=UPI001AA0EA29|nr:hypothetical protein [Stenotrophomonas indicatrix]MBO1748884.1 hypothetical protein [Stenotrophomonas indicatrix]
MLVENFEFLGARVGSSAAIGGAIPDLASTISGLTSRTTIFSTFQSSAFTSGVAVAQALEATRSIHAFASKVALLSEIKGFGDLPEDWDGEGAAPIASQAISTATQFVELMGGTMSTPIAYPNPNGTITLAWRWRTGRAELEIGKTRHSWIVVDKSPGYARRTSCSGDNERVPELGMSDLARAIAHSSKAEDPRTVLFTMKHVWEEAA